MHVLVLRVNVLVLNSNCLCCGERWRAGNSTQYFAEPPPPPAVREQPPGVSAPRIPPSLLSHYVFELDAPEKHWRALLTLLKSYRILAARYSHSHSHLIHSIFRTLILCKV